MVLGDDPDLEPTDEELQAEEDAEPTMMRDAGYWDAFLKLVDILQEPWAEPEQDTQAFREARAVKVFNAGGYFPACPASLLPCPMHSSSSASSQHVCVCVRPQGPRLSTS